MTLIENLSDAYAIIEVYEMGGIEQNIYRMACNFTLEHFRKKYGKDSFWFRELFACLQGEDTWEFTFEIRCLVHAEVIGCPHENCEEYKELALLKKCQHCSYIGGVKKKWNGESCRGEP